MLTLLAVAGPLQIEWKDTQVLVVECCEHHDVYYYRSFGYWQNCRRGAARRGKEGQGASYSTTAAAAAAAAATATKDGVCSKTDGTIPTAAAAAAADCGHAWGSGAAAGDWQ